MEKKNNENKTTKDTKQTNTLEHQNEDQIAKQDKQDNYYRNWEDDRV
ncbi:hypothetical protein H1D32_08485 [Anaerobacillus sp. CMMVII]|nr:hypothetical protein [Anaerobacillus sp. CMMVII]MCT8137789.1 hypothetical protein [Anaerobacillus sp. CMMVII]